MRWCRPCWCRTKRSSALTPESESSKASRPPTRRVTTVFSAAYATVCSAAAKGVARFRRCRGRRTRAAACRRLGVPARRQWRQAPERACPWARASRAGRWQADRWQADGRCGGSFLGTAAAAAAGVVGGSLLLNGIRSMMGGQHGARRRRSIPTRARPDHRPGVAVAAAAAAISRARPGSTTSDAHPHQVAAAPATAAMARSTTAPAKMINDDQDTDDLDDGDFDSDQGEDV